jgi:hypothetical protein
MNANRRLQERKQPERMVFCKLGKQAGDGAATEKPLGRRFRACNLFL